MVDDVIVSGEREIRLKGYQKFVDRIDFHLQPDRKHRDYVRKTLKTLAVMGTSSTWELSPRIFNKKAIHADVMTRRLLEGRTDRGKKSPGLVEFKLVSSKIKDPRKGTKSYRLTLFGLLYTIKSCVFTDEELYDVAQNYPDLLPNVFGKAELLRENDVSLIPLRKIAKGDIIKLQIPLSIANPYMEMLNFVLTEFPPIHHISESKFAEFIGLLFYTHLMWEKIKVNPRHVGNWTRIILGDPDLRLSYGSLIQKALKFYTERNLRIQKMLERMNEELRSV